MRGERNRPEKPPVKPEDVDTWREDGRDPNAPERGWISTYSDSDGRTTKGWYWIPPGHPFHWTHKYRGRQLIIGDRTILPSLPKIPYEQKLKPCRDSESNMPGHTTSPANPSPVKQFGPVVTAPLPAAVFNEPTLMSASPDSTEFADLDLWQQAG